MARRRPRRVLVVQGGGMRGAYAAGAITELFQGLQFDAVWATSSGAASCAYGVAGQMEGLEIWKDHLHGPRLASVRRGLTGRPFLDLDYLIDEVFRRRVPLSVPRLHAAGTPLWVPVTDAETGDVRYLDATARDPFPVLRAAMSMPGAVTAPVAIDGRPYVDGGVIDQVPIRQAMAVGPKEIVVVLTRPASYVPQATRGLPLWLATRRFPGIAAALRGRHRRYADEMTLLGRPAEDTRVRIVRPGPRLPVGRWTRRRSSLLAAIAQGQQDARRLLEDA